MTRHPVTFSNDQWSGLLADPAARRADRPAPAGRVPRRSSAYAIRPSLGYLKMWSR